MADVHATCTQPLLLGTHSVAMAATSGRARGHGSKPFAKITSSVGCVS
jgi:hypothetical protein